MTALRDSVLAVLTADATLSGLLTGGMYAGLEKGINRQDTPSAFDSNKEIRPCLLVNDETDVQSGPYGASSRTYLRIFFYQRSGFSAIDSALARVMTLLNRQKIGSLVWEIRWTDDILNRQDVALDCSMHMSRYQAVRNR